MQQRSRWQMAIPYLVLLSVILVVFTILIVNHVRNREIERWQTELLATAQHLSAQAQSLFQNPAPAAELTDLAQSTQSTFGVSVTFLDAQGAIMGTSLNPAQQTQNFLNLPSVAEALSSGSGIHITEDEITATVLIQGDGAEILGLVHLQAQPGYYHMDLDWLSWLVPTVLVISALAVVFMNLIIQDESRRPIEMLTIAVQQMSLGNFKTLKFPDTQGELNELTTALRTMAEHLGSYITTLTSEQSKLNAVLNQMTDGVLITDSEGRVQLVNPTAARLFQMDEKSALGRSIVEVLRYHQLVELWENVKRGERQSTMLEIGPQHIFLQVVGIPLKSALPGSTLMILQDLTQLRRLETVRRDFISNVSHELRTPLASLKALAETLHEGALDDPPAAHRFILRMETEIDNLTQLVNELLELSRIESGKVSLSFQRIQACNLLRPAYERMSLQAERAGLELILDCQPDLPVVFADPDRITQVMINLIHNAIKFTPPGGKITISAYLDRHNIVFFVRDTGVGIARKDLGRIFERFYKADRARAGGGTGLGLSIARHMIESHGGYIWAESEEDKGSTLYFSLPIA